MNTPKQTATHAATHASPLNSFNGNAEDTPTLNGVKPLFDKALIRGGAMTPLQDFAHAVATACRVFNSGRGMAEWLVFHEAKQAAYSKLVTALPQVEGIEDFGGMCRT
jgi:hypothetical protein